MGKSELLTTESAETRARHLGGAAGPLWPATWGSLGAKRALAFASVYVVWGSTYLAIRIGVQSIPPFLLGGARFMAAGSAMFLIGRWSGARAPTAAEWRRATFSGIVMLGAGNGLVTWAATQLPSNLTALLIAAVPSYVILMDWLRPGGSRPHPRALAGVVLGALGMAVLLRPDPAALEAKRGWAIVAALGAGAAWAVGSLYNRYQKVHPNSTVSGAQQMLVGGATLSLLSVLNGELAGFSPGQVSGASWLSLLYLTIFGSMLAFSAFNWLVTVTTPAQLSTSAYVNPVVAVVLGFLVLGETLSAPSLAGAAFIICAVVVMVTAPRPAPRAP